MRACLLASVLLHLLLLWAWQRWAAEPVHRLLRPTRMELAPSLSRERFEPLPQAQIPGTAMEPLQTPAPADPAPTGGLDLEPSPVPEPTDAPAAPAFGGHTKASAPVEDLPTLEQMRVAAAQAHRDDREGYARTWLPDADTTDAASARRRRAREIVEAAIEAMGGRQALLEIRDLSYRGHFHQAFGPRSRYARYLPGGARLLYDGDRAVVDAGGERTAVRGDGLAEIRRVAERWDFLSRYVGDGVDLEYLGTARRPVPRRLGREQVLDRFTVHGIRVNDRRHGGFVFHAFFEAGSGLLQREDYPCQGGPRCHPDPLFRGRPWTALFFRDYQSVRKALLWTEVDAYDYGDQIYKGPAAPVSYAPIDPAIFAPSRPDTAVVEPRCCETEVTLWLYVSQPGPSLADSVLPAASATLSRRQRQILRERVLRAVHRELRRQAVAPRIELTDDADPTTIPAGDVLLRVTLYHETSLPYRSRGAGVPPRPTPPIYQATLSSASIACLMRDGPPTLAPGTTYARDPDCRAYQFRAYSIDAESIYTEAGHIDALARRTVLKVAAAVQQVRTAGDEPFIYTRDGTFCQAP